MPKAPFPYEIEEVTYPHLSKEFDFAATLTLPEGKGPFPLAILVTGSGPQDRDEALMGHKPFHVLADYLTRQGIAVLRFDDRGVGASGGEFASATSEDFATDAVAATSAVDAQTRGDRFCGLVGRECSLEGRWSYNDHLSGRFLSQYSHSCFTASLVFARGRSFSCPVM